MPVLHSDSEEVTERRALASEEIERLIELSPPELAAEILPLVPFDAPGRGPLEEVQGSDEIASLVAQRIITSFGCGWVSLTAREQLKTPIKEAIQVLVNNGLLIQDVQADGGVDMLLTRLGSAALSRGDVLSYLDSLLPYMDGPPHYPYPDRYPGAAWRSAPNRSRYDNGY